MANCKQCGRPGAMPMKSTIKGVAVIVNYCQACGPVVQRASTPIQDEQRRQKKCAAPSGYTINRGLLVKK